MAGVSRQIIQVIPALACLVLLQAPVTAAASGDSWLSLRNHNPFLQVYGLPAFTSAETLAAGQTSYGVDLDIANHADAGETDTEAVMLDGESYYLTFSFRHGLSDRFELAVDIPFTGHAGGFLDASIENWHDLWGLSTRKRGGARDQLRFSYDSSTYAGFEQVSPGYGIGDIRLSAGMPLGGERNVYGRQYALRAGIKLPTGSAANLRGSGAADFSLGIYMSDPGTFAKYNLSLSGFAGLLLLGNGDVLPDIQRDAVGFGGIAATWRATEVFAMTAGMNFQSAYYDSNLDEIGGNSVQLALGGVFDLPWRRLSMSFRLVEDLFDNATTDFAFQVSVHGQARAAR